MIYPPHRGAAAGAHLPRSDSAARNVDAIGRDRSLAIPAGESRFD